MTNDAAEPGAGARTLVVILNFNGIDDTIACLESLQRQTFRDFVVQVIDNASRADDLDRIRQRFPDVLVVALPQNLGWAGGNNVGLRHAVEHGFRHVCLLNNDTVLAPGALGFLTAAATAIDGPCLLHPAIAYFDEPTRWQLDPGPRAGGSAFATDLDIVELSYAYGACLMVPVAVVRQVGLLDERFFLQLEETDYFRRAQAFGIRSFCVRDATMLHRESASFGGQITENKTYYQVRNTLLLAEKHTPGVTGFLRAVRGLLWSLHHQAQVVAGVRGWPGLLRWLCSSDRLARAARQGGLDYIRRRFGRRPAGRNAGSSR